MFIFPLSSVQALALLGLEILEFIGFVLLLKRPGEPQYKLLDLFQVNELAGERSWLLASLIGFLFLLFLVLVTSLIADQFLGTKVSFVESVIFLFPFPYLSICFGGFLLEFHFT